MSNATVVVYFGGVATDVTAFVTSVNVRRGRSRELDRFSTGTAQVVFNNEDRRFDPLYSAGPYFGKILPRLRVQITSDEVPIFDGVIEDWNLGYTLSGKSDASIACVDGLALLAQTNLVQTLVDSGQVDSNSNPIFVPVPESQQSPGERITSILARPEVAYPGAVALDPGFNLLQADVIADNTDTLSYLDKVVATDLGRLFVDGAGVLRYRDRTAGITSSPRVVFAAESDPYVQQLSVLSGSTLWFDAASPLPLRVDDDAKAQVLLQDAVLWFDASDPNYVAPVIPFSDVAIEVGSEFLFNRIQITRAGGVVQVAVDDASVTQYGVRTFASDGLLFLGDSETAEFADFLASLYSQPDVRVTGHQVLLHGLPVVQQRYMKRLEIGDVVRTVWTPNNVGQAFDSLSLVEGIEHRIGIDRHEMMVQLTPFSTAGFILDDPNRGLLDTSELTY
jgi:hypothetical protein